MRQILLFLLISILPGRAAAQDSGRMDQCRPGTRAAAGPWMQYADPEAAGWSNERLEEARKYAEEIGATAVLVLQGGNVVAAWGDVTERHNIFSIRKSLLGALYGIAVERGQIDIGATLAELGIDDEPPLTEQERTATVENLLKARSGVYHTAAYETSGMEKYRPDRDSHEPGTNWFYNNWDFNTLVTIYQQKTGEDIFVKFDQELAKPLGLEDFRLEDTRFRYEEDKSIHPAYLFDMSARDLARLGELWLQEGCWGGRSVVPAHWVRASVTSYSKAFNGGYGYMSWWTYPASFADEYNYPELRQYDSYMTTGSGGQAVWVIPDLDLVFVHQHERVNGDQVGAPKLWTLLDRILASRAGRASADAALEAVSPVSLGTEAGFPGEEMRGGGPS